jgi:hypothetical protein
VLIVVAPHFASIDVADQAIFHSNKLIEDSKISVSFRAPSCSSLLWFVDSGSFYLISQALWTNQSLNAHVTVMKGFSIHLQ